MTWCARARARTARSCTAALTEVLAQANATLAPEADLRVTVGDEFQGTFATVGQALHATLWLRLHLAPRADLRHGVGWGAVQLLADEPRVEDGPGWWAARRAIEEAKAAAGGRPHGPCARRTPGRRGWRTPGGRGRTRPRSTRR